MTVRIIFDETKKEIITPQKCNKFSEILDKLNVAAFRLLFGPITPEKLQDEEILFIGGPQKSFKPDEIETIAKFVLDGGFLILVCNSSRNYSLNINSIAKYFNVRFDFNHVKDAQNHWSDAIYFPVIKNLDKKNPLTKNIKKLYYSGSTLTLLTDNCIPLAYTSDLAEPPNTPIIATSVHGRCILIGGSTLFYDDDFGIEAGKNYKFVINLLNYLKLGRKNPDKLLESQFTPVTKKESVKILSLKKAKEIFNKNIKESSEKYEDLYQIIDDFFDRFISMIRDKKLSIIRPKLKLDYKEIQIKIRNIQMKLFETVEKIESRLVSPEEFIQFKQDKINNFYVLESEVNEHLDRIYGRLDYYIENPEAIP
ncbi:MAG: hypothetical protein EU547_05070 [Promethearchaeota archaeon]|nr:MAG: hypothetical protein EU547_05070 [Candidatus Lokiarchaeota archaeon]